MENLQFETIEKLQGRYNTTLSEKHTAYEPGLDDMGDYMHGLKNIVLFYQNEVERILNNEKK